MAGVVIYRRATRSAQMPLGSTHKEQQYNGTLLTACLTLAGPCSQAAPLV